MATMARSVEDAVKLLQNLLASTDATPSLSAEGRRQIQNYIEWLPRPISNDDAIKLNTRLKAFWERLVGTDPVYQGAFVGVLRELRSVIRDPNNILAWWELSVRPVLTSTSYPKVVLEDAQEYLLYLLTDGQDTNTATTHERSGLTKRLTSDLINTYLIHTRSLTEEDQLAAPKNVRVAQHVETVLLAWGRKQPKDFLLCLDEVIRSSADRLQGLTLLSSFLSHDTPHLYVVNDTPLLEHLLICLMNDTSMTVLSVALTALVMLLPHLPGLLAPHLPRLFLVYSRLLCWEKFSPLSSQEQKNLVVDNRVLPPTSPDHGDVGIDVDWEKARPKEGAVETTVPQLMTYFTYLYGLYPLNLMRYIRKPRRYLKAINFPGADAFDLDQAVIRSRSEPYRLAHLLHPNFYLLEIDEELTDSKWSQMEPADVVAACNALCMTSNLSVPASGPPPTGKLPQIPPISAQTAKAVIRLSPSTSHASLASGRSWKDNSTVVSGNAEEADSPVLRASLSHSDDDAFSTAPSSHSKLSKRLSPSIDDFPLPGRAGLLSAITHPEEPVPQTNLDYLQRENTLLRNDLNFERWHKAQYSAHISQLMRKNVQDATTEAETLNLINANRALKLQLERAREAKEASLKDSKLTRKQANNLERDLTERLAQMKKEQEQWRADAKELERLRGDIVTYRDILLATEQRELVKSQRLELVERELEKLQDVEQMLHRTETRLREFEYRDWQMRQAHRQVEILQRERQALQIRLQTRDNECERLERAFEETVAELKAVRRSKDLSAHYETQTPIAGTEHTIADVQKKLDHLHKKHTVLREKYTALEKEYGLVTAQRDTLLSSHDGDSQLHEARFRTAISSDDVFRPLSPYNGRQGELSSDITPLSENTFISSASDPGRRHFRHPVGGQASLSPSETMQWPLSDFSPISGSGQGRFESPAFNEFYTKAVKSDGAMQSRASGDQSLPSKSDDAGEKETGKVKPNSADRVYGRGGLQNIKMKSKDGDNDSKVEKKGLRGLRNLV